MRHTTSILLNRNKSKHYVHHRLTILETLLPPTINTAGRTSASRATTTFSATPSDVEIEDYIISLYTASSKDNVQQDLRVSLTAFAILVHFTQMASSGCFLNISISLPSLFLSADSSRVQHLCSNSWIYYRNQHSHGLQRLLGTDHWRHMWRTGAIASALHPNHKQHVRVHNDAS